MDYIDIEEDERDQAPIALVDSEDEFSDDDEDEEEEVWTPDIDSHDPNPNAATVATATNHGILPREHYVGKLGDFKGTLLFFPVDVQERVQYVNRKPQYQLHVFGALQNGSKVHVMFEDIEVFCYVRVPENANHQMYCAFLSRKFESCGIKSVTPKAMRPSVGYQAHDSWYCKCVFDTVKNRNRVVKACMEMGLETANNEKSNYHRIVAREHRVNFNSWIRLEGCRMAKGRTPKSGLSEYVISVSINNASNLVDAIDGNPPVEEFIIKTPSLLKDRTTVMTFDIETYTPHKGAGTPPDPDLDEDKIFMICATLHWRSSKEPLAQVCLVTDVCEGDSRWHTVVCKDQRELLYMFAMLFYQWAPDHITGFNDGRYDWPFIVKKAAHLGVLPTMYHLMSALPVKDNIQSDDILRWNYNEDRPIKVTAEKTVHVSYLYPSGCVPIDARVAYMKLYPKAEKTSLNFFLSKVRIQGKADMPHTKLWEIYEEGNKAVMEQDTAKMINASQRMRLVAHYCVIDALRCQELLLKRNIIMNNREVGAFSYTSMYDCVYYAGGHKVCNVLCSYASRRNIACNGLAKRRTTDEKFEGAWVVNPVKGLHEDIPVGALDVASLYPSIMMGCNISSDMIILDNKTLEELRKDPDEDIYECDYNFANKKHVGYFRRHKGKKDREGLYVIAQCDMKAKRKVHKKVLNLLEDALEEYEVVEKQGFETVIAKTADSENKECQKIAKAKSQEELDAIIDDMEFRKNAVDSKQKAIKVFMNTFYGEAGNPLSPWYLLPIAACITITGQRVLKRVYAFVEKKGFKVVYGDTDSLYLKAPESAFIEAEEAYKSHGDYRRLCEEKVMISIRETRKLQDEVNVDIEEFIDTDRIRMVFEEVLFPTLLAGKKKYAGIAHKNEPNFDTKKMFIRGIDVVKQGQTPIANTLAMRCLWKFMELRPPEARTKNIIQMVTDILSEGVTNMEQWNFSDFVQSAAWRPEKKNQSVHLFMRRMRTRNDAAVRNNERRIAKGRPPRRLLYMEPEPGERFRFVIVEREKEFSIKGHTKDFRKGDLMEYEHVAKKFKYKINVKYYLMHYVVGLCGRFINGMPDFEPEDKFLTPRKQDESRQKKAVNFLKKFIRELGVDTKKTNKLGSKYQKIFKEVENECTDMVSTVLGSNAAAFLSPDSHRDASKSVSLELFMGEDPAAKLEAICRDVAYQYAEKLFNGPDFLLSIGCDPKGRDLGRKSTKRLYQYIRLFRPSTSRHGSKFAIIVARQMQVLIDEGRSRLRDACADFGPLAASVWEWVEERVMDKRAGKEEGEELLLDDKDMAISEELNETWYSCLGTYITIALREMSLEYAAKMRDNLLGCMSVPAKNPFLI